jgi:hypothetical protein
MNLDPKTVDTISITKITESTADVYHSDDCYTSSLDLNNLTAADSITISSSITSPFTHTGAITGAIGAGFPNSIYTTSVTGSNIPWMSSTLGQVTAPKIRLDGEGADIEVNGWSLVDAVKRIEERLAIMQPNPKLETEWEELKQLGDQYRKLEQHIKDKQDTWDRLKAMPPPEID